MHWRVDTALTEAHWKSLHYFKLYRVAIAILLLFLSLFAAELFPMVSALPWLGTKTILSLYLLATIAALAIDRLSQLSFDLQLTAHVLTDILVMVLLATLTGGQTTGFGAMLLISLAAAGLVGQGRLVLFYAATATLALLAQETYRSLTHGLNVAGVFQAGLLSGGFFATAISARLLATRVIANEQLARRRGIALRDQTLISQRVIEDMQDGVLVLREDGLIRQRNPQAESMLHLDGRSGVMLAEVAPELERDFHAWQQGGVAETPPFRVRQSDLRLRARFIATGSSEADVLVFLEDVGRLQVRAQEMKLAALGRLTANIAHEIRNPLTAISHAAELLLEDPQSPVEARLSRIIVDNSQRLERIVRDVLELGRRDRSVPETLQLAPFLRGVIEEWMLREALPATVVSLEVSPEVVLCFDRFQLHQVLNNLIGNALRHASRQPGSVRVVAAPGRAARETVIALHDDGPGVAEGLREQIFEPFFTTHARGTGLGLYLARELCEANGARLEFVDCGPGACFRLTGRNEACLPAEMNEANARAAVT